MIRVGTDIVEISRFSDMENLELFKKHTFTSRERAYFDNRKNQCESIAGAFAAKEAFSKYMGSGFRGFGLKDVEVLHDELGKPYICFLGRKIDADVSISHSRTAAVAVVCGEGISVGGKNADLHKSYRMLLPKRSAEMHKGDCGRVLVVAGSVGMVGAACLCAQSALRCGSGLVTLATAECSQPVAAAKLTEVMTLPLKCKDGFISVEASKQIEKRLENCDVCAIGPGMGASDGTAEAVKAALKSGVPCVVDADALNVLAADMSVLAEHKGEVVLTPHPGEMARLLKTSSQEVENDREAAAVRLAKEYGVVVLLKGHRTVIAAPSGEVHINSTGNGGMASGGMGDVLTGVIASFIGQGVKPFEAAVLGAFLHGLAGDMAADKIGEFGLIAGDVVDELPYAIRQLEGFF